MALRITTRNHEGGDTVATLRADRRIYLTADQSECVEEGDPRAAFLLAGEGRIISADACARYKLRKEGGKVRWGPKTKKAPKPENKMAERPDDKGDELPEWPLKTEPAEYLEQYPDGPNAELAREIIARDGA